MFLLLMFGLSLIAASAVLVMRSFALAQTARRRTLDQIEVYGFRSDVPAENEESPDLRTAFGGLATATGERALARFDRLRAGEGNLRKLLNSAGMYQTSVASFVGSRILTTLFGPALIVLLVVGGNFDLRLFVGCVLMTVMGWYFPYVRVQRRARLRIEEIDLEVPELVDLLVTTVEAGVGFASGLQLASRSIQGPLGQELRLALREQSLGPDARGGAA